MQKSRKNPPGTIKPRRISAELAIILFSILILVGLFIGLALTLNETKTELKKCYQDLETYHAPQKIITNEDIKKWSYPTR